MGVEQYVRCPAASAGVPQLTGCWSLAPPRPPAVVDSHRLANGLLFGLPVVLDTEREDITLGDRVLLTYNGEVSG